MTDAPQEFAGFHLEEGSDLITLDGIPLRLSQSEQRILLWLMAHPGVLVTAEELRDALWGRDSACEAGTVQVHIHNLRRKIEADPSQPRFLRSVWGKGYIFSPS